MACFREKRKGENPPFFDTTPKGMRTLQLFRILQIIKANL